MRTTIRLNPDLLSQLKRLAAETHRTMASIIEDGVRESLARQKPHQNRSRVKLPTYGGGGLHPGIDLSDNASIRDVIDPPDDPHRR